jgi:hypothetical protein
MYVNYTNQLSDLGDKYQELLQEWLQLEIDHEKGRLDDSTFCKLRGDILSKQNVINYKREMYAFLDIYDLLRELLHDEFRSLSDDLV